MVRFVPGIGRSDSKRGERVKFSSGTRLSNHEKRKRSEAAKQFLSTFDEEGTNVTSRLRSSSPLRRSYRKTSMETDEHPSSTRLLSGARSGSTPGSDRLKSILRNSSAYQDKKSYELLDESPIRTIRNPDRLGTERIIDSMKKKSYSINDSSSPHLPCKSTSSHAPVNNKHEGLLGSLSMIGSKLLNSVLYSESEPPSKRTPAPNIEGNTSSALHDYNTRELRSLSQQTNSLGTSGTSHDTEKRPGWERQLELDRIKRDLEEQKEKLHNKSANFEVGRKFEAIERLIQDSKTEFVAPVLNELGELKRDMLSLKASHESMHSRFAEKYEQFEIENELNRRKFEKLFNDLERKRDELDKEKNTFIKLLQNRERKRKYYESEDEDSVESSNDNQSSEDVDYQEFKKQKLSDGATHQKINRMRKRTKLMNKSINENINNAKKIKSLL